MSDTFESIKQGLTEAIQFANGENIAAKVFEPKKINVKQLRKKIGMTQLEFAAAFGISVGTLRHWERGDRMPRGPARILLNLVEKDPGAILKVLYG